MRIRGVFDVEETQLTAGPDDSVRFQLGSGDDAYTYLCAVTRGGDLYVEVVGVGRGREVVLSALNNTCYVLGIRTEGKSGS